MLQRYRDFNLPNFSTVNNFELCYRNFSVLLQSLDTVSFIYGNKKHKTKEKSFNMVKDVRVMYSREAKTLMHVS